MITLTRIDTPRAWIGCLACYNAGRLTGEWYDADTADLVTPADLHGGETEHEELWVMDHEGFLGAISGECSPDYAAEVADALAGLRDDEAEAFAVWLSELGADIDRLHWVDQFRDEYRGFHQSEAHYAQEWAEETSTDEDKERMKRWPFNEIDWDRAAEELFSGGFHTERVSGGIHVFSSR
ncbi:antirestriction protein ArdA [Streptomyces sp. GMY02]|uniref:antirestriction protein ArdA n=1 Tax=Streptomyces sp. GMY02 TaxID=1333528 RepID=UPI001C2C67F9|nr:antirestriction protein ArdA [Streptomyces sp. GMY02]QXE37142.1 antirestriction protein ArdA [Streptomyces sp. GMY02]